METLSLTHPYQPRGTIDYSTRSSCAQSLFPNVSDTITVVHCVRRSPLRTVTDYSKNLLCDTRSVHEADKSKVVTDVTITRRLTTLLTLSPLTLSQTKPLVTFYMLTRFLL